MTFIHELDPYSLLVMSLITVVCHGLTLQKERRFEFYKCFLISIVCYMCVVNKLSPVL